MAKLSPWMKMGPRFQLLQGVSEATDSADPIRFSMYGAAMIGNSFIAG
jgi:hypothetical protein